MSFKQFEDRDIVLSTEPIISTAWSDSVVDLSTFPTSSIQEGSSTGDFFLEIYNQDPTQPGSIQTQFSVAYANVSGSGATPFNTQAPENTPTSVLYKQIRTLIYKNSIDKIPFGTGDNIYESEDFFLINVDRGRYKEKIAPGSLKLTLSYNSNEIVLSDKSDDPSQITDTQIGQAIELKSNVSGSVEDSGSYGKLLPEAGLILLNPKALQADVADGGIELNSSISSSKNYLKVYNAIDEGGSFFLASKETVASNFFFIRIRNDEFNYTLNPSARDEQGNIRYPELIDNPVVYVTTIGLYNDNRDLVAVAKLSRPLQKSFTKEGSFAIKLDY